MSITFGAKSPVSTIAFATSKGFLGEVAKRFPQQFPTSTIKPDDPFPNTPSRELAVKALATSAALAFATMKVGNPGPRDTAAFLPAAAPIAYVAGVVADRLRTETETEPNRPGGASSSIATKAHEPKVTGIDDGPASTANLQMLQELISSNTGSTAGLGR